MRVRWGYGPFSPLWCISILDHLLDEFVRIDVKSVCEMSSFQHCNTASDYDACTNTGIIYLHEGMCSWLDCIAVLKTVNSLGHTFILEGKWGLSKRDENCVL